MIISKLINKRLGLLGFGREGQATEATLRAAGHLRDILVFTDSPVPNLPQGCRQISMNEANAEIKKVEIAIRSPGFSPSHPLRQLMDSADCLQTTATQIFLNEARDASISVIGVTASKGKSTTSTLAHLCLLEAGCRSALVGNIGQPAIELLAQILKEKPLVVMELSSYQCADLVAGYGPTVASIGSLFPEHLDYHGSFEAYIDAKLNIARTQRTGDSLVCHVEAWPRVRSLGLPQHVELVNGDDGLHFSQGWFFDGLQKLFPDSEMRIPGLHNRANACLALALTRRFGVTPDDLSAVLGAFGGLPFRLESEGVHRNIQWYNDSISTAPEATAAALEALGGHVHTLIAGGYERGYEPRIMIDAMVKWGVREVVLLPDTGAVIAEEMQGRPDSPNVHLAARLEEAVQIADRVTPNGAICLLSPGAPSYNAFSGFEARGREFRRCVRDL